MTLAAGKGGLANSVGYLSHIGPGGAAVDGDVFAPPCGASYHFDTGWRDSRLPGDEPCQRFVGRAFHRWRLDAHFDPVAVKSGKLSL